MNSILGARIRSLRESKGLTQEDIARKMDCSRQKYARIEKGVIDISYSNISIIAEILGVSTQDITSAVNNIKKEPVFFRGDTEEEKFKKINEMINIFYVHRKLYNRVRQVDVDE
ncbi:MAG: helix-turn-helix transcriptional regulator [Bacillota bacterium]